VAAEAVDEGAGRRVARHGEAAEAGWTDDDDVAVGLASSPPLGEDDPNRPSYLT